MQTRKRSLAIGTKREAALADLQAKAQLVDRGNSEPEECCMMVRQQQS